MSHIRVVCEIKDTHLMIKNKNQSDQFLNNKISCFFARYEKNLILSMLQKSCNRLFSRESVVANLFVRKRSVFLINEKLLKLAKIDAKVGNKRP